MKLSIIICCFNEKATISKVIQEAKVLNIDKEIIVIDNCSTDGTKEILEGLKGDNTLKIIFNPKNMGPGYSGFEGIRLARGDYFYGPGADLEYSMEDVYQMIDKAEKEDLDVVLGSRLMDRKNVSLPELIKERPFWLGTIIGTFLINFLYRRNFTDVIGSNLTKVEVFRSLGISNRGHAEAFEFISRICKRGCKIGEVPVYYKPRPHKEGKTISVFDMLPAILVILRIKIFG